MLGSHYVPDGWVDVPLGRLEQYQRHIDQPYGVDV